MKGARWLPDRKTRAEMAWLLGSALVTLIICAGVMTIVIRLDRPAQAVQQACITTTAARG